VNVALTRRSALPNLVVIGAQKCGTTSLHYYLDQHPEISMSRTKELDFFTTHGSWSKGMEWYAAQFDAAAPIRGESSPSYTNYPIHAGVPARLHAVVPEAKLVYLVRDPIDRIVSQYIHDFTTERERRPIDEVLAAGIGTHPYVARSRYFMQLGHYLPFFPLERIFVVSQEELLHERTETLRRIFEFLETSDPGFAHARFARLKHRTSSHRRRKTRLGSAVATAVRTGTRPFDPPRWLSWKAEQLLVFPLSRRVGRPVLSDAVRRELVGELSEDADRLRELTGRAFEGWCV
jgi:hypothetical protein